MKNGRIKPTSFNNRDPMMSNEYTGPNEPSNTQDDTIGMMSGGNNSMSGSMSSTTSGSFSFNRVIKDFKKALGERKTPRNLRILNRIVALIVLGTIVLTSINYSQIRDEITKLHEGKEQNMRIESRAL